MNNSQTKIIIDPGHGGFDPGGGSNQSFKEKEKNLQISLYQKRRFDELGIPSVLVREYDETLDPSNRINRIRNIGQKQNDILISNHINSGASSGGEIIYSKRGTKQLPNIISNNLSSAGLPIRNVYTRLGQSGNDYYFILRDTIPNNAMIIEYGFATNETDTKRLDESWNVLAEAVVKSIATYLGVSYVPPAYIIYNVKKGDTLYEIAKKYNITVENIKSSNGLSTNTIFPNQSLIIYK